MSKFTEKELRAIEQQLRCPDGEMGIEMGKRMNVFNQAMTNSTIDLLALEDKNVVLELGHGNGGHVQSLLQKANNIQYYGLDISETMHEQAKVLNQALVEKQAVDFQLYDGLHIPFEEDFFDKIMTVNTIYFWADAKQLMAELARVLKPQGMAIITFAHKSYLEKMPAAGELFTLIEPTDMIRLAEAAGLKVVGLIDQQDEIENSAKEMITREFCLARLTKG